MEKKIGSVSHNYSKENDHFFLFSKFFRLWATLYNLHVLSIFLLSRRNSTTTLKKEASIYIQLK